MNIETTMKSELHPIFEQILKPFKPMHSLTFLHQVEDAIWCRLGRKVLLDDISATEVEQLWFMAKDPSNADNAQLEKSLNAILHVE